MRNKLSKQNNNQNWCRKQQQQQQQIQNDDDGDGGNGSIIKVSMEAIAALIANDDNE